MIKELLRKPLPQEVVALLEKIDSLTDRSDSSYYRARSLVESGTFSRYERLLLRRALNELPRRETLHDAMDVVINTPVQEGIAPYPDHRRGAYATIMGSMDPEVTRVRKGMWGMILDIIEDAIHAKRRAQDHRTKVMLLEQQKLEQDVREREMSIQRKQAEVSVKFGPKVAKETEQRAWYTIKELNERYHK